ncbi:MAG TPA: hypothetical protein ENN84_02105, partial [Candidatus Marinimicrobia bacterium]|nr:hypothetical protein [Candidatus Neomarinimicrobiota bacterium]
MTFESSGLKAYLLGGIDSLQNSSFQLLVNGKPKNKILDSLRISSDTLRISARISGPILSPRLTLNATLGGLKRDNFHIEELHTLVSIEELTANAQGEWYLRCTDFTVNDYRLNNIWANGSINGEHFEINSLSGKNDRDRFELSAKMVNYDELLISAFAADIGKNKIRLQSPFDLIGLTSGAAVSPAVFSINDGEISMVLSWTPKFEIDADLQIVNISAGKIFENLAQNAPIQGLISARILFSGALHQPVFSVDAVINDGRAAAIKFKELSLKCRFENGLLHLEEANTLLDSLAYTNLSGHFPLSLNFLEEPNFRYFPDDSLFLNIATHGLWLGPLLSKMDIPLKLNAKAAVFAQMNGTYAAPRLTAEIGIDSTIVDELYFERITGKILYGNEQIQFQDMRISGNNILYEGNGFLPLNLSLMPVEDRLPQNKRLMLNLRGSDKNLVYLSPYLTIAESIQGDFYTEFEMTGTLEKPIRNGRVQVKNGRIVLQDVDNPITNINGNFTLVKNIL